MPRKISQEQESTFVAAYSGGMSVSEASQVAQISRPTAYRIMDRLKLRQKRDMAEQKATQRIDDEMTGLMQKAADATAEDIRERFRELRKERTQFYEGVVIKSAAVVKEALDEKHPGYLQVATGFVMRDWAALRQEEMMLMSLGSDSRMHITWVIRDDETKTLVDERTFRPIGERRQNEVFLPYWMKEFIAPARFKSARGGRGSSKSWSFAAMALLRMRGDLPGYGPPGPVRIVSARDYAVNMPRSVKRVMEMWIEKWNLQHEFYVGPNVILHRPTGSECEFLGVSRNPESFLSMEGVDVFWMEQAEVLQQEMVLIEPSIRAPGSELWMVWNPNRRSDWCWTRFVSNAQEGDVSTLVNYHHNPWWGKILEDQRVYYEQMEPSLYPWMWEGQPNDGDGEQQVLPHALLKVCVAAWDMRPDESRGAYDAGFDVAEGGIDRCAVVVRHGPAVLDHLVWPGKAGDLEPAAKRAHEFVRGHRVMRFYYDAAHGMKGPLLRALKMRPGRSKYGVKAVGFGGAVAGASKMYDGYTTNAQMFALRNMQMAQTLRLKAQNTYRLHRDGEGVDPENCLFINPHMRDLNKFLDVLTQPIRSRAGGVGVWSLNKFGESTKSPDQFDALCLAFARDSERGISAR